MTLADLRLSLNAALLVLALALAWGLSGRWAKGQEAPWQALASGRAIADAAALPSAEPFLFTAPASQGFSTQHWAYDLGAWGLHRLAGAQALSLVSRLALLLALIFILATCFQRGSRPFSSALFSLAALAACLPLIRNGPTPLALACSALALALMEGDFWSAFFSRWFWLAPLSVVWANVDPSAWLLAPLALAWVISEGGPAEEGASRQPRLAKVLTLTLLSACLFLQPGLWRQPWLAMQSLSPSPLQPGQFPQAQGALLMMVTSFLLIVASSWAPGGRATLRRDSLVLGGLALASLVSADGLPFFCLWAAPVCAARVDKLVDAMPGAVQGWRWPLKLLALVLAGWSLSMPKGGSDVALGVPPAPKQVFAFYRQELLDARLLVEPGWEERSVWELGPNVRVSALPDTRLRNATQQALGQLFRASSEWPSLVEQIGAEGALLKIGSPLAKAMAYAKAWQPVSFDDHAVLYVKALPQNQALIQRYAPRGLRPGDADEPFDPGRLAQVEADLEVRLSQHPQLGRLHLLKARLWREKGQPSRARQALEDGIRVDPGLVELYVELAGLRVKSDPAGARQAWAQAARLENDASRRELYLTRSQGLEH